MPQFHGELELITKIEVPSYFKCPISLDLMRDPVSLPTGITYDRDNIEAWFDAGNKTCPVTRKPLVVTPREGAGGEVIIEEDLLLPNHTLRRLIQAWSVANGPTFGVDRIPTPKPPANPQQVKTLLQEIANNGNHAKMLAALRSLQELAKGSQRSKRCIVSQGAPAILANLAPSHESLSILITLDSFDAITKGRLLDRLDAIFAILNKGTVDARTNVALLVEKLAIGGDRRAMISIGSTKGAIAGLVLLLKEKMYGNLGSVKAGLKALLAISIPTNNKVKMVEQEAFIPSLVELLPEADHNTNNCVMALLNTVSECAEGRSAITHHALAIPALVRHCVVVDANSTRNNTNNNGNNTMTTLMQITHHALSAIWSLCFKSSNNHQDELVQELAQLGLFNKLLLLVQVDSSPSTKQKAKDILKLLTRVCGNPTCSSD